MTAKQLQNKIRSAKHASGRLLWIDSKKRKKILLKLAEELIAQTDNIIKANKKDLEIAEKDGKSANFINRLTLDKKQIKAIADSVKRVANFPDKLGDVIEERRQSSGIVVRKIRVSLGLVAIIYESRPNVTIDAFALTFKSGNALIIKGGGEIKNSNKIFVGIIKKILKREKISVNIIQDFSGIDRTLSSELIRDKNIDCLIPRGGKKLIDFVKENAKVPLIITGASVVHTYVDEDANLDLARKVILNAKTRRVSICNALDVLLAHKKNYKKLLKKIADDLADKRVEIRADALSYNFLKKINFTPFCRARSAKRFRVKYPYLKKATIKDFDTEFLDYILAVKVVNSLESAIVHIQKHTLGHSEAIITSSREKADKFFKIIDAACLYWNTSTQFSDGGEFGLGAEIGISTQKLHARGPFANEALTTYKYIVTSNGAARG